MKRIFLPILLGVLMISAVLPSAVVFAGNDVPGRQRKQKVKESVLRVKPITGTWINLAYKDVRNRYTNRGYDGCRIMGGVYLEGIQRGF